METNYIAFYEAFSKLVKEELNVDFDKGYGINRIVVANPEETAPSSLGPKFTEWVQAGADSEARCKDLLHMLQENGDYLFAYATGSRKPVALVLDENNMPIVQQVNFEVSGKPNGLKKFLYIISMHTLCKDEVESYTDQVTLNYILQDQLNDFQTIALPQVELHESMHETAE
jgi:hypothetical protein